MKKWIGFIVFCFIFQGIGWAQLMNAKSVTGQVSAQKGSTITIRDNNGELTLELTDATRIILGSEVKTEADIRVGDHVTALYREKGNLKTALSITITPK